MPGRRGLATVVLLAALLLAGCGEAGAPGPVGPRRTPPAAKAVATVATPVATPTSPRTVVRTYTDAQGRPVSLFYGRAVGRRGDWGYSHIIGKHLRGEWKDGGPLTRFDVINVTTPEAVQEIIGRSLQDPQPDSSARGRREYRLPVGERYEMLTVVGDDGAIITAYPDSPRGGR